MTFRKILMAAVAASLGSAALAAKLPLYDDFTAPDLDTSKWVQGESMRFIDDKGRLVLGRWGFGGVGADTGTVSDQLVLSATDNLPTKGLKVSMTVTDLDPVDGCAANPTASSSRARLMGNYFTVRSGGPVAGDMTGDILAQMFVRRNSSDPAGLLHVQAGVVQCNNVDCSNGSSVLFYDLGTAAVGQKVTLQQEWDKANNLFRFIVDGGTPTVADYSTKLSRTGQPGNPFNQVAIRNDIANCTAGRVKAGLAAQFDNFGILR